MMHAEQSSGAASPDAGPPLSGVKVLDFSNLLPGPLATLILAEAGADVIKVERPSEGDEMRSYAPAFGDTGANFALLNRGKQSLCADLKDDGDRAHVQALARSADVLIEQFRPGVMDRLELGYAALSRDNPGLIYCSITGYGQTGAKAHKAGHDLNYLAETGLLGLTRGADGAPVLPPVLAADIGGGAYPAVINVLLALQRRMITGRGCHLDVSMCDNLFTFGYWGLGAGMATGQLAPTRRRADHREAHRVTRSIAAPTANTWRLRHSRNDSGRCSATESGSRRADRDDAIDPETTRRKVAALIAARTANAWRQVFDGVDACVSVVASMEDATRDPAFVDRGLFARQVTARGHRMPALPVPLADALRNPSAERASPALGPRGERVAWTLDPRESST